MLILKKAFGEAKHFIFKRVENMIFGLTDRLL